MNEGSAERYNSHPRYPTIGGSVDVGLEVATREVRGGMILAADGPQIVPWDEMTEALCTLLESRGLVVRRIDTSAHLLPWDAIVERTSRAALVDDPDFETLPTVSLAEIFDELPTPGRVGDDDVILIHGPGAALFEHDVLWYADVPKRYAEAAVKDGSGRNLGQPADSGGGTTRRLFYVDWPLLDRHRDAIASEVARWFDLQASDRPTSIRGEVLTKTVTSLSRQPFRTRPTFNTTPWGGHWAQRELGMNTDALNTALGYELIGPESGVLVGEAAADVEIPFQLIVSLCPRALLGDAVHAEFGGSFPIRFDYLDTVGGGPLSVHVHPRDDYMREVFGWPYTQHETYYMMVGSPDQRVYLGLREETDVDTFEAAARAAAEIGEPYDVEEFVQVFEAIPHQLFLIPAGTPHASGQGNVVLEVSSTPYLYSLRFYDWLRTDAAGARRPVHVPHAFVNLNRERRGSAVARDLVPQPETMRAGTGWREELLGRDAEMFFDVRRLVLDGPSQLPEDTDGRFHVLNLVEGHNVTVRTHDGYEHPVAYAETLVIPAAVGSYTVQAGSGGARLVKAVVR